VRKKAVSAIGTIVYYRSEEASKGADFLEFFQTAASNSHDGWMTLDRMSPSGLPPQSWGRLAGGLPSLILHPKLAARKKTRHCEPSSSDEGEAIQGAFMA
jgi:hypothetical protein